MGIQWVSTPESRAANRPSVLAVVETILAMGFSVGIALWFNTSTHIAVGACIAPFLLMRTDLSCKRAEALFANCCVGLGVRISERINVWLRMPEESVESLMVLSCTAGLVWLPVSLALARVIACLITLVRNFPTPIAAIPLNWWYSVLVLDSKKSAEILAKPSDYSQRDQDTSFYWDTDDVFDLLMWTESPAHVKSLALSLGWNISLLLVVLPAYVYRWSLKSTALIWFPLLWAFRSVRLAAIPLQEYFSMYVRDLINKIVLWLSISSVVLFVVKVILWSKWNQFDAWMDGGPIRRFLGLYIQPKSVPPWQIAMAINSALAIAMYLLAAHWLVWLDHRELSEETSKRRIFRVGLFIRPLLSCYTISWTLTLTVLAAFEFNFPPMGNQWVPPVSDVWNELQRALTGTSASQ